MKVFSLQAPIYRGAWLSSRLTAQTSQLGAVRRDALERWRRARSRAKFQARIKGKLKPDGQHLARGQECTGVPILPMS